MAPESNAITNVPEPEHPPDRIGGPATCGLVGRTFQYSYPTGLSYRISFDEQHVYFTVPSNPEGIRYIGVSYRQRQVRPNIYLTHWMVPGRNGHVSLVFDLEQKKVDAAALMPGLFELFDRAIIDESHENGENALWLESTDA